MKKSKFLFLVIIGIILKSTVFASDVEYIHPYKLNPVNDGIQIGVGGALAASGFLVNALVNNDSGGFDQSSLDKASIPAMDQMFMNSFNKPVHYVSTATELISLVSPLVMLTVPSDEYLTLGVMYAETIMYAYGIKEWGKFLIDRARPYTYYADVPQKYIDDGDWKNSFPSGHTTLSFASAAFLSSVFNQYYPDSGWRFAVTGISFGLAATTGALRMVSGNHFFSDVMTGAVIGTLCGFLVPYMHTAEFYKKFEKKGKSLETMVSPAGFSLIYKF